MRESLLKTNYIEETDILVNDLKKFTIARLVNAMLPFRTATDIKLQNIRL
jgi:Zn-finger domain-containing protein